MYDIIGIGSTVFDMLMLTESFPAEDSKVQAKTTRIQAGGPCATALVTASCLGAGAAYMGTVGDDMYGKYMLDSMRRYRVGVECVRTVENCESFHCVVLINEENVTRTVIWNKGTVPMPLKEDINLDVLKQAKYLYLDGHQTGTAIYAAKCAREFGVKVFLDAGGRYPGIENLLPLVDVLIPSEEFAHGITGADTAEAAIHMMYESYHPEILVVTQGRAGGILYNQGSIERYPAFMVDAIDTNGAGDVFHGAFAAGLVRSMTPINCARFASAVSAMKCRCFGTREGIPDYEQALAFMRERGVTPND